MPGIPGLNNFAVNIIVDCDQSTKLFNRENFPLFGSYHN